MSLKQWFSPGVSDEQKFFLEQQQPIILMGRGHSGTRVLSWACSHLGIILGTSDGLATGDSDDQKFTQEIKKIATKNVGIIQAEDANEKDLGQFQKAVYSYYERLGRPEQSWGWKFPETYLIAPYAAKTFPKARYLHLVRDGRDIAFKKHLTDDPSRTLGKNLLSKVDALQLPRYLQAGLSWGFQVDSFDQFRLSIPEQQIFDIRFEDICLQPFETISGLCTFLQIEFNEECKAYLKEKIDPEKVAQYKENDPALVKDVESKIEETLKRYRYL